MEILYTYDLHFNLFINIVFKALSNPPSCPQVCAYFPLCFCYPWCGQRKVDTPLWFLTELCCLCTAYMNCTLFCTLTLYGCFIPRLLSVNITTAQQRFSLFWFFFLIKWQLNYRQMQLFNCVTYKETLLFCILPCTDFKYVYILKWMIVKLKKKVDFQIWSFSNTRIWLTGCCSDAFSWS